MGKEQKPTPTPSPSRRRSSARTGGDPVLGDYLAGLGKIPLLTAEQELEFGRTLRESEELSWNLLLRLPMAVDHLLDGAHLKGEEDLVKNLESLRERIRRGGDIESGSVRRQKAFAATVAKVG
jgi:hypothetical protein